MNFVLTRYIYPIETKQILSEKLNIFLDNPRTEYEIETVAKYIQYSQDIENAGQVQDHEFRLPLDNDNSDFSPISINGTIRHFFKRYSERDSYVKSFEAQNKEEDIFRIIAKMWIVARFDDEGQIEALRELASELSVKGEHGFFMLDDEHPLVRNEKILVNYSYLLSLLLQRETHYGYYGKSFVLHHNSEEINAPKVDRWLNNQFMYFGMFCSVEKEFEDDMDWIFYPNVKDYLYEVATNLDVVIDDKILYVANLLKIAGKDVEDEKITLVVLVSILELLLTHSPDYSRFNIEDSISKQFRLKTSILVYLNDRARNLDSIKTRLKTIYNQRSNIAHGNFKSLEKFVQNLSKKEGQEEYFEDLILDLYVYLKAILEEYVKDRSFVEFLKAN